MPQRAEQALVGAFVDFAGELREAGLVVGGGDVQTFCAAAAVLDPADLLDVYWAGRTTLVSRQDDIATYTRVFQRFFLGGEEPTAELLSVLAAVESAATFEVPAPEPGDDEDDRENERTELGLVGSSVETLKHKSFAACNEDELALLRKLMAAIRLNPPRRRSRRTASAKSGRRPDLRRTVRESLRTQSDPVRLHWRRRRVRPRPVVLILDISGSMADYSRALLQFAYSALRATTKVEVFCFGTRLTYLTQSLRTRKPDEALRRAAGAAVDWEGGTRIGASLAEFLRLWGPRGICRGGIVVICSDGCDRGDPELLDRSMRRLARLAHRVVWLNPHRGAAGGPGSLGMLVAEPHVDELVSGRDLTGLVELAELLPKLG